MTNALLIPPPPFADRPYQSRAVTAALAHEEPTVIVCPTGGGKTRMGTSYVRQYGQPVLWIVHRDELGEQGAEALRAAGLSVQVIQCSRPYRTDVDALVASVQTLARRSPDFDPGLIVLDEAHHYMASQWREVALRWPGARTL
jgi:superfamily II DNA or RNA helicase